MEVIVLTTLFSVLFALLFLVLFVRTRQDGSSCADEDALLPFRDESLSPPKNPPSSANDSSPSHPLHEQR